MFQNGLPYSADNVEQGLMLQGLPQSVPHRQPPMGFPPDLIQYSVMIDGILRAELQNKATTNHLRAFLFNQMASQGYVNGYYDNLLEGTAKLMLLHFSRQVSSPNNIQHAASVAAEVMCRLAASRNLRDFPALGQYIDQSDHNLMNDINNNLNQFEQIAGELRAMFQPQQPHQANGVAWNSGMANQGGFNQQHGNASGWQQGNQWRGNHQPQHVPQNHHHGQQHHTPQGGGRPSMFTHTHTDFSNVGNGSTGTTGGLYDVERPQEKVQPAEVVTPVESYTFTTQEVKHKIKPADNKWEFDNVTPTAPVQPSQRTFTERPDGFETAPDTETNIAYNADTHQRVFVLNQLNQVVEKIIPKGDNMTLDYEQHETQVPPVKVEPVPVASSAEWHNYHYDEGSIAVNPTISGDKAKVTVTDLVDAHSDEEAEMILRKALHTQGIPVNEDNIFEFQYRHLKPIAVSKNCTSGNDIAGAETIAEFKELLLKSDLPERVVGKLNRRAVDILNEALKYKMSVDWDIASIEDYDDLITELANDYGQNAVLRFTANSDKLVRLIYNALDVHEASQYLIDRFGLSISEDGEYLVEEGGELDVSIERLDETLPAELTTETVEDEAYDVIVMADTISITQVPWTFEDMQLTFDESKVAKLSSVANETEYRIFQDLFERTEDLNVRHYYIDTQCGRRLKIHQGWMSKDYVSIALV